MAAAAAGEGSAGRRTGTAGAGAGKFPRAASARLACLRARAGWVCWERGSGEGEGGEDEAHRR